VSLYPLDAVRNAVFDLQVELVLEDVREDILAFPFSVEEDGAEMEEVLEAYDLARPRLNVLASLLTDCGGRRGADISAGLGFLPVVLTRAGLRVAATEVDPRRARFAARHGVEVLPYRLGPTSPPFPEASLDFLILAEVLEHLKLSPVPVLRELASLLQPGGRFVLTTPNIARLSHLGALAAGENFLEPFPENLTLSEDATDHVEHVREYSVREVVDAVEAVGLEIERVVMTGWGENGYHPHPNPYANDIIVLVAHR
jgi:2-polyprenyl-3-methyl-5-hydroxy-6-metoxy-1,4-benzoquinol methylase